MCSGEPINGEKDSHERNIVKYEHGHHAHRYAEEVDSPREEAFRPHQAFKTLLDRLVHRRWFELDMFGAERGAPFG